MAADSASPHANSSYSLPASIGSVVVDAGNLMTFNELKRKASQSSTEELVESVSSTLGQCMRKGHTDVRVAAARASFINTGHATAIEKEERRNLKITVKLFLGDLDPQSLDEAVHLTLERLTVASIESLLLSFPAKPTLADMQPLWRVLEDYVDDGRIVTIGACDLDLGQLRELHAWARVKPTTNQVNLESCCSMPPEMTAFAKEHVIQLLTHSDPKVILPDDAIAKIAAHVTPPANNGLVVRDAGAWRMKWTVRYAVQVKCRGIIQSKGYILCLARHDDVTAHVQQQQQQ